MGMQSYTYHNSLQPPLVFIYTFITLLMCSVCSPDTLTSARYVASEDFILTNAISFLLLPLRYTLRRWS
jgi:hypothetical protein